LEGLVGDSSSVGDFLPESNNDFSVGTGEGLGDYGFGRLLFLLTLNGGEVFLFVRLSGFGIEAVGPGEVLFGRILPGLGSASGGAGGASGGSEVPEVFRAYRGGLGDGSSWFVGVGVSGLWAQFANFGSKLSNLLLKLGDPIGTGVLGGSKCILHAVEAGKNLVHDAGIGLIEEHGAESVLGEGGVDAFARSRGAGEELSLLRARGAGARADARGKDFLLEGGRSGAGGSSRC
jgi:hypothetical protein